MRFKALIQAKFFLIGGVIASSGVASADNEKCAISSLTPIKVYGEVHDTPQADKVWRSVFREAEEDKMVVLLEALQSEANSDPVLKKELLEFKITDATDKILKNVYGIDSLTIKVVDVFGASYLIFKEAGGWGERGQHIKQLTAGVLGEPMIKNNLLAEPMADGEADRIRSRVVRINSFPEMNDFLENAPPRALQRFFENAHARAILAAKKMNLMVHEQPLRGFQKDPEIYLLEGRPYRDEHMADQIQKLSCISAQGKSVSAIVGITHLANLEKELRERMPKQAFEFIEVEE
jgi:hypothetical protein